MITKEELAACVDHTNLNLDATPDDIIRLCEEAIECGFGAVCVRPHLVRTAAEKLREHDIHIASVVGFPTEKTTTFRQMAINLSRYGTGDKVRETEQAIERGADEIDMVMDLCAMKWGNYHFVEHDIRQVVIAAKRAHQATLVKVIMETCYLNTLEIALACKIAECAEADFVKTSTGYGVGGATLDDMRLMSKVLEEGVGIKASGGIHTVKFAQQLFAASQAFRIHDFRIGASKLVDEYRTANLERRDSK
ncbi:deoxyribose-phosphate aldolase [Candidatus Parcubacteria bacterium]|nr:deoxyribose-phosphate aldolase [Candidatus Parcubacteria bacterium]